MHWEEKRFTSTGVAHLICDSTTYTWRCGKCPDQPALLPYPRPDSLSCPVCAEKYHIMLPTQHDLREMAQAYVDHAAKQQQSQEIWA